MKYRRASLIRIVVAAAVCWAGAGPAAQASDIVVAKRAGKIAIDLSGIQLSMDQAAQTYQQVLSTSIARSGWLAPAQGDLADYAVTGRVQFDGGAMRVQLQVNQKSARRQVLSKSYSADASGVRRIAHEAADDILRAVTGQRGFASSKLLMLGTRTGHKELYISDSDGRGLQQLTNDRNIGVSPRWGHDNQSVYYTSFLRVFSAIYRIDLNTRARSRVVNFAGLNTGGAVSPDGRDMAVILSKDGNPDLYIMRISDGSLTRITTTPRAVEASPAWSPDGRELVFVSDQAGTPHLFVVSRSGGTPRQLTTRGRQNVSPDWGPHGEIVYTSLVGGKFQVHVINPRGGESRQLTSDHADHEDPTWAPNGRHIAIARKGADYKSKVYLIDTMGDPPILLTDYDGDWYAPKWSR
ncbi:MAG TPA: hypothetical protein PKE26_06790 [Kiritimatiellia bacterium]|nr:hypothetical protein [Kiritimatiellia bacterium]HMO98797.1 hypothetical protein [Kiritimatiellia bacterium]